MENDIKDGDLMYILNLRNDIKQVRVLSRFTFYRDKYLVQVVDGNRAKYAVYREGLYTSRDELIDSMIEDENRRHEIAIRHINKRRMI